MDPLKLRYFVVTTSDPWAVEMLAELVKTMVAKSDPKAPRCEIVEIAPHIITAWRKEVEVIDTLVSTIQGDST